MGTNGLCSSGFFGSTPSVCTSLPRTGARGENGDQALPVAVPAKPAELGLTAHPSPTGVSKRHAKGERAEDNSTRRGQAW